jgi:hypothetical protein
MKERSRNIFVAITVCLTLVVSSGCSSTKSGTVMNKPEAGGFGGGGMGALLGQTSGGSTTGTLTGAGVGAGLGYLIGNEADRNEVSTRVTAIEQDTWPLANTTWQLSSVTPTPAEPIKSKVGRFNADGTLTTTTTYWDGRMVTDTISERYRVVGQTLIINQDDWIINAIFRLDGDSLYVDTGRQSLVLERLLTIAIRGNGR